MAGTFPIIRAGVPISGQAPTVRAALDVRTGAGAIGAAIGEIGQAVTRVGRQFKRIEDNRHVAQGIAEYNNLINTYNESLAGKDPNEYVSGFEALGPQLEAITGSKSRGAQRILNNKFVIWNETNRASIALLAVRSETALAKQEIPDRLRDFANKNQDIEAEDYISEFSNILSPREQELWLNAYGDIKDRNTIFKAINLAAENPTSKNISLAQQVIDKLSVDEIDIFNNRNRLRAKRGQRTEIKNETFKALMNKQSNDMADSYLANVLYEGEVLPELNMVKAQFDARLANGTLGVSDDATYESILDQLNIGTKFFSENELASAFATGMSKEEYIDIKRRNKDNAKLTKVQKEALTKYNSYIDDRYRQLVNTVDSKTSPTTLSEVLAAADSDKATIKRTVLDAVREGLPDNEIYDKIEIAFIADTDRIYKGWWSRKFSSGFFTDIGDFEPDILEIGDRQERYEVITDIMKSGEKFDLKRLDDLLERWYE